MRLLTRTQTVAGIPTTTSVEASGATVAGGALILAVIQIVGTLAGNLISNNPKIKADKELALLKERNLTIQLFQRVLENDDAKTRANSLILLINAGLISDEKNEIRKMCQDTSQIPKWSKHPLESSTGVLESGKPEGAPPSQGGSTPKKGNDTTSAAGH